MNAVTFVIIGASGDLATHKIVPALFALFIRRLLPEDFRVFGFCRTKMTDEVFRERLAMSLTSRCKNETNCSLYVGEFLARCHASSGAYDDVDAYLDLYARMAAVETAPEKRCRMFYMAIPPTVFSPVTRALGESGLVRCGDAEHWSRVVVEKPFGRDRETSDQLVAEMAHVFLESETFRIDHYLAKELVQNLLVLRLANPLFEPVWNAGAVERVDIVWKESKSLQGRAGYFDTFGIVRDVMQNHLLQILALIAIEPPGAPTATAIRDAKVRLLKAIRPLTPADVVFAQYDEGVHPVTQEMIPGYRDEPGVAKDSRTPTYASVRLAINTPRWQGVPFTVTAGKGMDESLTEVRIVFRKSGTPLFPDAAHNQLILRVQPDEAITHVLNVKTPGLSNALHQLPLNLLYKEHLTESLPDAYERLLLDVLNGDRALFIRADELAAAWDIFTPLLHACEANPETPLARYPFGAANVAE